MRQTLFYFPETIAGVRLFGWGWALFGILALAVALLIWTWWQRMPTRWWVSWLPTLGLAALLVYLVLPMLERMPPVTEADSLPNHGVPIRGYGAMLALAALSAVWLATVRATRAGLPASAIQDLALSFFICGLIGARAAFLWQHWESFQIHSVTDFLREFIMISQGGLVVYGSLVGAAVAFAIHVWRFRLPVLVIADVLAPALMLGLALGRVGCFLNGCCWGGLCNLPWGIAFPEGSPPYVSQVRSGALWGFSVAVTDSQLTIGHLIPGGAAERAGLELGQKIKSINNVSLSVSLSERLHPRDLLLRTEDALAARVPDLRLDFFDGRQVDLHSDAAPGRSLTIHPTQLYDAISALLVMWLLLQYEPFRRRAGEMTAICFMLYPLNRFLLEIVRDDEMGLWGSAWTFSQWFSLVLMGLALALGLWLVRQPTSPCGPVGPRELRSKQ